MQSPRTCRIESLRREAGDLRQLAYAKQERSLLSTSSSVRSTGSVNAIIPGLRASSSSSSSSSRVVNGYGLRTSKLSIASLGMYNSGATLEQKEKERSQEVACRRASEWARESKRTWHPSRKELFMQKYYPVTMRRLQQGRNVPNTPGHLKSCGLEFDDRPNTGKPSPRHVGAIVKEAAWNERKRLYYQDNFRKASVNKIITGEAPNAGSVLFPVGASHQQILGVDNKLVGANPANPAPRVEKQRRWLGDNKGWAGNRGLKTMDPDMADGIARPWPTAVYGRPKTLGPPLDA